jgi:hypothetical protein
LFRFNVAVVVDSGYRLKFDWSGPAKSDFGVELSAMGKYNKVKDYLMSEAEKGFYRVMPGELKNIGVSVKEAGFLAPMLGITFTSGNWLDWGTGGAKGPYGHELHKTAKAHDARLGLLNNLKSFERGMLEDCRFAANKGEHYRIFRHTIPAKFEDVLDEYVLDLAKRWDVRVTKYPRVGALCKYDFTLKGPL